MVVMSLFHIGFPVLDKELKVLINIELLIRADEQRQWTRSG